MDLSIDTSPSESCGCGSSLPTQLPSLGTSITTSVSPGTSVMTPASTTSSDSATTEYLHPFPFSNHISSKLCLSSALAIASAFEALPLPAASSEGSFGGVVDLLTPPRTMPSFACCAMQSAYTLLMIYHRTWVQQQQQHQQQDSLQQAQQSHIQHPQESQILSPYSPSPAYHISPKQAEQQTQQQRTHHLQTQALLAQEQTSGFAQKHQAQTSTTPEQFHPQLHQQAQEKAQAQAQTQQQTLQTAQKSIQEQRTQLLERCEEGLRSVLQALDNYSIAFEALGGMKDQVQVAIDCLNLD
jgi:hypothetical protein